MPKPVLLIAAAARSKPIRRFVVVVSALSLVTGLSILTPLVAIPLTIAAGTPGMNGPRAIGGWGYPLAGDYTKADGFGPRNVVGCAYCSKNHRGYDMFQECGATVYAAGPGRVIRAGAWDSFGNAVEIDHGGGVVTIYGHMMWDSLKVVEGQQVLAGTPIGLEGETGVATGCHVHFEIRINGAAVNPEPFMAALGLPLK